MELEAAKPVSLLVVTSKGESWTVVLFSVAAEAGATAWEWPSGAAASVRAQKSRRGGMNCATAVMPGLIF